MRVTQGTFSFLPDRTDEQIEAQLHYALSNGWAISVEYTDDPHPRNGGRGITMSERGAERRVRIPGSLEPERAAEIEEAIWDRLHFATHLRSQRLGEYTIGMDLHRSESLALVQLLILYHLVTGRAAVALGRPELERVAS